MPVIFIAIVGVDVASLAVRGVEEVGLKLGDPLQVEPVPAQHHLQRHVRLHRPVYGRERD